jgi:GT2 family glycosyltransferase
VTNLAEPTVAHAMLPEAEPASPPPRLAVVMATRNRLKTLRLALDALIGRVRVPHEIIVVDLGSTDGTLEYLEELEGVRLARQPEPAGQAQNLNGVFAAVEAPYICWLSDDNVAQPGMLDVAVSILDGEPGIGLVALKVKDVMGPMESDAYVGSVWPTGVLNCNQGVIRAALFRQIGFFDEAFKTYGVDPDLTTQVLLAGYKVVHTRQVAIHHYRDHAGSPGALVLEQRQAGVQQAKALYARKYARLIALRSRWRMGMYWLLRRLLLYPGHRLARKLRIPVEQWLGVSERDWTNLLYTQYVSLFDFFANRGKPYYLAQSIPPERRVYG